MKWEERWGGRGAEEVRRRGREANLRVLTWRFPLYWLCKKLSAVSAKHKDTAFQSSRRQIFVVSSIKIIEDFSRTPFFVCSIITDHVYEWEGSYTSYLITSVFPTLLFPSTTWFLLYFLLKFLCPVSCFLRETAPFVLSSPSRLRIPPSAQNFLPPSPSSWPLTNPCLPLRLCYTTHSFLLFLLLLLLLFVCFPLIWV